jgi:hypothetical protein
MKIEYEVAPADWSIFADFHLEHSPSLQRIIRKGQMMSLIAGLLVAGVSGFIAESLFVFAAAAAATVYLVRRYPRMVRNSYRKQFTEMFDEAKNPCLRGTHLLEVSADGVTAECAVQRSMTSWAAFDRLSVSPAHAILYMDIGQGYVISRERVTAGDYDAFVAASTAMHAARGV